MICDNACKKLFGNIEIASYIINHVCREYKSLNHEEVKKCIQHEPLISEVNVHDYENKSDDYQQEIRGLNVEHSSNLEGTVRFDSLLDALNPITKENITIIFNIEGQKDYFPPRLYKRGQYYSGRLLSRQYGLEFSNGHYENLKKVYSIWICFDPAKEDRNTISVYKLGKENVYGNAKDYTQYNLSEIIYICLGNEETDDELLGMLNVLFSKTLSHKTRKDILRNKYKVKMTEEMEKEAEVMCNYSDYIEQRGINKGREEGRIGILYKLIDVGSPESFIINLGYTEAEYNLALERRLKKKD